MGDRTWTLNASELLRVVWEAELDGVLTEVNTGSVGKVGICRTGTQKNTDPLCIATIGRIDFVAKESAFVSLKSRDGAKEHVDGEEGEVYVLEYHKRKKVAVNDLPCSCVVVVVVCLFVCLFFFFHCFFVCVGYMSFFFVLIFILACCCLFVCLCCAKYRTFFPPSHATSSCRRMVGKK
jgi:hypothetical protein